MQKKKTALIAKPSSKDAFSRPRPGLPEGLRSKTTLVEGVDFKIVTLDETNVCKNKKKVKKEGKEDGERIFQGLLNLLRDNFPLNEIENEAQYRRYFHQKGQAVASRSWFVDVAVNNSGEVIGASLYSHSTDRIAVPNLSVVKKGYRRQGIAKKLKSNMLEKLKEKGSDYTITEVEQPDPSVTGKEGMMLNVIRPAFHDNVTKSRAIKLENGKPLTYLLPIMATDSERKAAIERGEPLEAESLLFCLRPLSTPEEKGISSREAARLVVWFYKDYLGIECSDVKSEEINELLAITLTKLSPDTDKQSIIRILRSGRKNYQKIMDLMPESQLSFIKVSEAGSKLVFGRRVPIVNP